MDIQAIAAYGIVAVAAIAVSRRVYGQIAALRTAGRENAKSPCETCGQCEGQKSAQPQLITLSAAPPRRGGPAAVPPVSPGGLAVIPKRGKDPLSGPGSLN